LGVVVFSVAVLQSAEEEGCGEKGWAEL
jgi:hypothetical protein